MGVFENVEVLGLSGADLETELLHHQTRQPDDTGDPQDAPGAGATPPPAEPEAPSPDPAANPDAEGIDAGDQPSPDC